jgi:hypothetical protein
MWGIYTNPAKVPLGTRFLGVPARPARSNVCGKGYKSDFFAEQKIYSYGIIYKYISTASPKKMTFSAVLGRENGPGGLENSRENKV